MSNAKGVDAPNYTQSPNVFFDEWMRVMDCTEFKVVAAILRQTFGWHKDRDRISLSQLETWTGLSRQGVVDGIAAALERGVIDREPSGNSFSYALIVNSVDQSPDDRSNELTTDSQTSRPEIVNSVDTQKKETKLNKDSGAKAPEELPDDLLSLTIPKFRKALRAGHIPEETWPGLLERELAKPKPRKGMIIYLDGMINPKEPGRSPLFDIVALRVYKAKPGTPEEIAVAGRVGNSMKSLRQVNATLYEFQAACDWYSDQGLSPPRDSRTGQLVLDYRDSQSKPSPNGSTMSDEQKAAAIAAADAEMNAKIKARISAAQAAQETAV